ncbi:MAG: serine/threonine protein kinase, partial [Proteobacteria bacterium]|nr:serine/threonine protein kinase [Pseudomonadota bacterium]
MAHYELIRQLGRGGMRQVFLARDTKLARLVALKFLGVQSSRRIERFLVEARATARCHHDNIVVIHEAGEWQGRPYMALEYLDGQPLSALLYGRRMSPRRAVELVVPVVRALVRAHELDIIHRDLKPENIFVTRTGSVKVLDFGIAKIFAPDPPALLGSDFEDDLRAPSAHIDITQPGAILGTMPYMSPEQWGADTVDHKTDLWAVGIMLWRMLTGGHPLDPLSMQRLQAMAFCADEPMPSIESVLCDVPAELARIIDRCLAKRKEQRMASARELLDALELLMPDRYPRRVALDECPYPGMTAFQECDASRFFGRITDIAPMVQRLRDQPLVAVVGQSGIGKSSFVRAGLVPALKSSDESWEVLVTRPGRQPTAALAALLGPLAHTGGHADGSNVAATVARHGELTRRLWREPGLPGTMLRNRARQKRGRILLFVDQFEELYTLVADPAEHRQYAACLAGAADDPSSPLRVVLAMRSDLLDRVADHRDLLDRLTRGLLFLPAMNRTGMRSALVEPLEMAGYAFESESVIDDMLDALEGTAGALPLLQFTAAKLWDARDRRRRLLTAASYQALGGVAGALASHADEVLSGLATAQKRLTRSIFQRLVTSDGTRALADVEELEQLADDSTEVRILLDHLVAGRLLGMGRGEQEGSVVEIVHESLIDSWPTLRRWREESAEDSAFLEQLCAAARQWQSMDRPTGLLWRGGAMQEAQRFHRRYQGELSPRERDYLHAVLGLAARATRRKRQLVIGAFAFLCALVVAASVALLWVHNAEQLAQAQKRVAEREAGRARNAEADVREKLALIQAQRQTIATTEAERKEARQAAAMATEKA